MAVVKMKLILLLIPLRLVSPHRNINAAKDDIPDDNGRNITDRLDFLVSRDGIHRAVTTAENFHAENNEFISERMKKYNEATLNRKRRIIEMQPLAPEELEGEKITFLRKKLIYDFVIKFKKIPRVSLLTCSRGLDGASKGAIIPPCGQTSPSNNGIDMVSMLKMFLYQQEGCDHSQPMSNNTNECHRSAQRNILMKIVQINQLVKGINKTTTTSNNDTFDNNSFKLSMSARLEKVLRSEVLRQLIVLDLSCGVCSRTVIEAAFLLQALERRLFNSSFHWLFIADHPFNEDEWSEGTNKGSRCGSNDIDCDSDPINDNNIGSNASDYDGRVNNDDDMLDFMKKFLSKADININTELILAKRTRGKVEKTIIYDVDESSRMHPRTQDFYTLYDIWNPGLQYGGKLNISEIGNFSLENGLQISLWYKHSTTITRRMDMKKALISCMMVITNDNRDDTLEHYLTTPYDTHLDSMHRFNFALLSHVRELFNFSLDLSSTNSWGYPHNGKFDGLMGALVQRQVDIGGSPVFFYLERAKVIDYTAWTWTARPCFVFRHPRSTNSNRIIFLQPFSHGVWISISICGSLTIILLWILKNFEKQLFRNNHENGAFEEYKESLQKKVESGKKIENDDGDSTGNNEPIKVQKLLMKTPSLSGGRDGREKMKNKDFSCFNITKIEANRWKKLCYGSNMDMLRQRLSLLFDSIFFYFTSISQQGTRTSTRLYSGCYIVCVTLIFSFLIYQFYSASIVGTSLIVKPQTIKTISDLIRSPLKIGIEDIPYNRDYFSRTKDTDSIELQRKKMQESNGNKKMQQDSSVESNWYDMENGIKKMQKGGFAFHVDVTAAYKIILDSFTEKEICDLAEIQLFPPRKTVNIVQKGSPLRKMITYGLRRTAETGLMDYQKKIWHASKPHCNKKIHIEDLKVDMQTFTSAAFVLIFGFVLSVASLVLELMYHNLWGQEK